MPQRTTLSYAVLGLLSIRPMSAYDIVQGYNRSLGMILSRSEASIYDEPKKLARDGLVTSHDEQRGRRSVAIYEITDDGKRALATWRDTEPAFPAIDAEPALRVIFADLDDTDDLRNAVHSFRRQAVERAAFQRSMAEEYLARSGPFQERQPVVALGGAFVAKLFAAYIEWCDDALAALDVWELGGEERAAWGVEGIQRLARLLDAHLPPVEES